MSKVTEDTITLEDIANIANSLPLNDSVSKILSDEEIAKYSDATETFLKTEKSLSFQTKSMGLTLLKTLSHLSGNKDKLHEMYKFYPMEKNRDLYFSVPFLPELDAKGSLLKWYQKQVKQLLSFKPVKGIYDPVRLLVLFYESAIFHVSTSKKDKGEYLKLAEPVFLKVVECFGKLNPPYKAKDDAHPWYSTKTVDNYREVAMLWKTTVDITTVRHGRKLPSKFRRPQNKLPEGWAPLLKIKNSKSVSMINGLFPLNGLSSSCREIRTYSSFLLHLVYDQRPGFLDGFKHTRVEKNFLNRLRVAHMVKEGYPNLPTGMPDKFQREMFLVLIEQAINSLANKHDLQNKVTEDLPEKFTEFNEQVQVKDKIEIDYPEGMGPEAEPEVAEPIETMAEAEAEAEPSEEAPAARVVETDYPDVTDMDEFGMGIQTMPFVFPFTYEDDQEEPAFEHIPNIRWDDFKWSVTSIPGGRVHVAESKLFVKKLEIVYGYHYDMMSVDEVKTAKPFKDFGCFIATETGPEGPEYYICKKGGKGKAGKTTIWIQVKLSEEQVVNIDKAFFFILPPPYKQHILAVPR